MNDHLEVWSLCFNKRGIPPSLSCVSTTLWLHHFDSDESPVEKAWWELYEDAIYCFEQILEAAPY